MVLSVIVMVQDRNVIKRPRIYVESDLREGGSIVLSGNQAHYLLHVLRTRSGDGLRLFNGRDGEWRGIVDSANKRDVSIRLEDKIREQPPTRREVSLFFAPIKKARMDWLIEKSVELGATRLHPVLTRHTEVRSVNEERIRTQIIEAAEQCERMDLPELFPLRSLPEAIGTIPVLACIERIDLKPLKESISENEAVSFLIGPEGGFSAEEKEMLARMPNITAVSLGERILRSETAAIMALCTVQS